MRVSFAQYRKMVKDRPVKFSKDEVEYRKAQHGDPACQSCTHFFKSKDRAVCEIFRPAGDLSVEATGTCDFHTKDGIDFPLLT